MNSRIIPLCADKKGKALCNTVKEGANIISSGGGRRETMNDAKELQIQILPIINKQVPPIKRSHITCKIVGTKLFNVTCLMVKMMDLFDRKISKSMTIRCGLHFLRET